MPEPLKYLFTAFYRDGSIFEQPAEDRSVQDPSRSAFFDVNHDQLVAFMLSGEGTRALVDLTTGRFEVNGQSHYPGPSTLLTNFRVIFFRRHADHLTMNAQTGEEVCKHSDPIEYHLGWQANTESGSNVQHTIVLR